MDKNIIHLLISILVIKVQIGILCAQNDTGFLSKAHSPTPPKSCEETLQVIRIKCVANSTVGCIGCDRTCEQYLQGVQCRPGRVDFPKCFCLSGYFKLSEDPTSPCVPLEQCPKGTCNNEVLGKKQKACGCKEVAKCSGCDDRCLPGYPDFSCIKEYHDEGRCLCEDGYIRFADGNCRPRGECGRD